ncbi:DUF3726 domain-containing protein [Spiribacter halobius]|uniref:DUF3726 domain-containing protein n=1 Tax=Sediminicurvatus halobius TaxID=2182432 RepID=A0A2U2N9L1_9GAMM|nr:DUF3726 domain-containing protein [Spiribacter halobius]PWG65750.1 hypothetical protein DEM34_00310 [Spiribacter halobius]UEX77787.1 DUF3726 domain-containing protein [Spiribacter halobius]
MRINHQELLATARRAFASLGFAPGEQEDAADMVAWLELHGLGGLSELGKGLGYLEAEAGTRAEVLYRDPRLAVIDAGGASVLAVVGQAVDLLCADVRESRLATVRVKNCHNRLLITGYLTRLAREGLNLLAYWENHGQQPAVTMVAITAEDELPSVRVYDVADSEPAFTRDLTLVASPDFTFVPVPQSERVRPRPRQSPTPEFMREHLDRCFGEGLEVDPGIWRELQRLAG